MPSSLQAPLKPPPGKRTTEWGSSPVVESVFDLLYSTLKSHRSLLDPSRVYIMGPSMGGLGAYMLAAKSPETFAAAVPMCGGGKSLFGMLLKDGPPCWFFHSRDDVAVAVKDTESIVEAITLAQREQGTQNISGEPMSVAPRCTLYEHSPPPADPSCAWMDGHNCWDEAYSTPELWEWINVQKAPRWLKPFENAKRAKPVENVPTPSLGRPGRPGAGAPHLKPGHCS